MTTYEASSTFLNALITSLWHHLPTSLPHHLYPFSLSRSCLRVHNAAQEQDAAASRITDQEQEWMIRTKYQRLGRYGGLRPHNYACRRRRFRPFFVDIHERFVNHCADVQSVPV